MKTAELSRQITTLIKESDLKLKELSRAETSDSASEQSKYCICSIMCNSTDHHLTYLFTSSIVRKNMQSILATKLKNATFELRRIEKEHCLKVQELHGDKPST